MLMRPEEWFEMRITFHSKLTARNNLIWRNYRQERRGGGGGGGGNKNLKVLNEKLSGLKEFFHHEQGKRCFS